MSKSSKQNALEQHIKTLSRNIKATAELEDLTRLLRKTALQAMLEGEMPVMPNMRAQATTAETVAMATATRRSKGSMASWHLTYPVTARARLNR